MTLHHSLVCSKSSGHLRKKKLFRSQRCFESPVSNDEDESDAQLGLHASLPQMQTNKSVRNKFVCIERMHFFAPLFC
ncbi:hypothetical protein CEXT_393051 [Caerostris extrusa]|uniref:Uncharacterized protein n=1 Tax=Caerostris extrusa TaxID=172846 RepID=A0AAV4VXG7_CAEEX|nr:hypothetical protein CEXT_393051 [Caerostris extrusa]